MALFIVSRTAAWLLSIARTFDKSATFASRNAPHVPGYCCSRKLRVLVGARCWRIQRGMSLLVLVGLTWIGCSGQRGALRHACEGHPVLPSPATVEWLIVATSMAESTMESGKRLPRPIRAREPQSAGERKNLRFAVYTKGGLIAHRGPGGTITRADEYEEIWVRGYPDIEADACLTLLRTRWLGRTSTSVVASDCSP